MDKDRKYFAFIFGERLKFYRKKNLMTQVELAQRSGVARQTIALYEKGARVPDLDTAKKICYALGIKLDEITDEKVTVII